LRKKNISLSFSLSLSLSLTMWWDACLKSEVCHFMREDYSNERECKGEWMLHEPNRLRCLSIQLNKGNTICVSCFLSPLLLKIVLPFAKCISRLIHFVTSWLEWFRQYKFWFIHTINKSALRGHHSLQVSFSHLSSSLYKFHHLLPPISYLKLHLFLSHNSIFIYFFFCVNTYMSREKGFLRWGIS